MDFAGPSFAHKLKECAFLLDVDGTIVDLAPTPHDVFVPVGLRDVLAHLLVQTGGALALVSGRPVSDLDLIFAPLVLPAVGGHGAEFRLVNEITMEQQLASQLDAKLRRELTAIAQIAPGIMAEDKGYSVALHYRLAPERADLVCGLAAKIVAAYAAHDLEILNGKFVIEVKQAAFNKATAVRKLMTLPPFSGRVPVFIGDDTTDEPVFAIMPEFNGLACSVGYRIATADICFDTPQDVRAWLEGLSREQERAES
jgi:trehalose 6-phosphate phosphatase